MKNLKMFFGTTLRWDQTINDRLKELSAIRFWDPGLKKNVYIFPVENLHEVNNLVGPLGFEEEQLTQLLAYTNQEFENVDLDQWKGKSGYVVKDFPKFWRVIEHRKADKNSRPKPTHHDVPKGRVVQIWGVIAGSMKVGESQEFSWLAPKICRKFQLKRFFYDQEKMHNFKKDKFQGSRKDYFSMYYYPLKVLQHLNLIEHKGRWVTKKKSVWEEQSNFQNVQQGEVDS